MRILSMNKYVYKSMSVFLYVCMYKNWVPSNERLVEYYTNAKQRKAENLTIHQTDEKLLTDTQCLPGNFSLCKIQHV